MIKLKSICDQSNVAKTMTKLLLHFESLRYFTFCVILIYNSPFSFLGHCNSVKVLWFGWFCDLRSLVIICWPKVGTKDYHNSLNKAFLLFTEYLDIETVNGCAKNNSAVCPKVRNI